MKLLKFSLTFLIALAFTQMSFGQSIIGSAHDFSGTFGGGEICIACHTPHNASGMLGAPLWNHAITAVTNYATYTSPTLNAVPESDLTGNSKLCLSCHDGTVALDAFGSNPGTVRMDTITLPAGLGRDLRNDHPIGFVYNATLATADGGGLHNPATKQTLMSVGTRSIEQDYLFGLPGAATLECASCHDVHNSTAENYLLRWTTSGSELCLECHSK